MKSTRLILVGGFLGAGKTTLLWETARRVMNAGKRVGLITNDQAPELVDTAILQHHDVKVTEVSGSCFCCNFDGLIRAMDKVSEEANADVIIAEPVGSCTDLSATIVNPLKEKMDHELVVSPLTVLADPIHLSDTFNGSTSGIHPSAAYIFLKQLEESDIILITKSDLLEKSMLAELKEKVKQRFPASEVMTISAVTGEGVDEWLQEVSNRNNAGLKIVDVDYNVYAEGEAVLGWLNSTIELSGEVTDLDDYARTLMQELSHEFDRRNAYVGHVKIMLEAGDHYLIGNLTGKAETLNFRGQAGKGGKARLTLNARVEMSPATLEAIVREKLGSDIGNLKANIVTLRCLSPGRPNPTFRFNHIVKA